jgi:hypothetical protein
MISGNNIMKNIDIGIAVKMKKAIRLAAMNLIMT